MVDNKEASNEIMKPSNGSSGLLYRVRMQAKKMVDIYAKVWNSFYGDKYYKQMLMLSVDMRKDRIPNILLDRLNGVMSVRFRLSVNEANYEAWKKASHELISTANVSFRLGEVEDYQGFLIGGRNYIFNAIEKSAIEQWKKVDNNRYIASLTARIQFLDTNKNVMWDDFVSVEEIRRPCWCYGSEWHYPSPLHELNRLRELPASRFDWRRGASDDVAVEDGGIWIRYSGLTEQQINSLTEIRCEILDEKDMQSIHEQKEKERQERKQKANEEFKERYAGKRYLVINLSAGPNAFHYPIETIDAIPVGGWTDEYKTTKLVLSLVPAGSFMMGSPENELGRNSSENLHQVTLTKG